MENLRFIDSLLSTDTIEVNHLNGKAVIFKDSLANSLSRIKPKIFTIAQVGATNIDMANPFQIITLEEDTTLVFNNPSPGEYKFKIIQGSTGTYTVTWPVEVKWPSSVPPTLSITEGGWDIITLLYDGTFYSGSSDLNYVE